MVAVFIYRVVATAEAGRKDRGGCTKRAFWTDGFGWRTSRAKISRTAALAHRLTLLVLELTSSAGNARSLSWVELVGPCWARRRCSHPFCRAGVTFGALFAIRLAFLVLVLSFVTKQAL